MNAEMDWTQDPYDYVVALDGRTYEIADEQWQQKMPAGRFVTFNKRTEHRHGITAVLADIFAFDDLGRAGPYRLVLRSEVGKPDPTLFDPGLREPVRPYRNRAAEAWTNPQSAPTKPDAAQLVTDCFRELSDDPVAALLAKGWSQDRDGSLHPPDARMAWARKAHRKMIDHTSSADQVASLAASLADWRG